MKERKVGDADEACHPLQLFLAKIHLHPDTFHPHVSLYPSKPWCRCQRVWVSSFAWRFVRDLFLRFFFSKNMHFRIFSNSSLKEGSFNLENSVCIFYFFFFKFIFVQTRMSWRKFTNFNFLICIFWDVKNYILIKKRIDSFAILQM